MHALPFMNVICSSVVHQSDGEREGGREREIEEERKQMGERKRERERY